MDFLLFIQTICLSWGKEERSATYAKKRAEFPMAYLLDNFPDKIREDVLVQCLNFWQKETIFQTLCRNDSDCIQFYHSVQDLNLTNLWIQAKEETYEVTFFYDRQHNGLPIKKGHNKDYHNINSPFYYHDILNETAFSLKQGQYGRIIWNERKRDYDTGEWYYQLHIINLLHSLNKMPKTNIFLTHKLDFEYKQMSLLY